MVAPGDPGQDTIVRRVLKATGMSLNEYVVGGAVAAAADDLADRRIVAVSPQVWEELQEMLDRQGALPRSCPDTMARRGSTADARKRGSMLRKTGNRIR